MEKSYGSVKSDSSAPSVTTSESDLIDKDKKKYRSKDAYPYSVFFILTNEFCERFSYYGMRAILVIYLTRWLSFGENQATSIFHAFSMLCYGMPLIGAVVADGYLGRYKTILYLSVVYFAGSLILSVTALPPPEWYGAAVGLFLIACGTGGIKASVAPFGADQFISGQEKWQNSFFSAFYFMINLGSMLSVIITPILRADVHCFGQDCYVLAFGIPAVLMFLSVLMFFLGRDRYIKIPPAGNIIGKTFKCIYYGIVGKIRRSKYDEPRKHWLYYADDKYDAGFIEDVRQLLKVLFMFLPLPLFWALSDQQGSRWTLQAEHMDGDMGIFGKIKPDQMQALNPLMILALIPLFDKGIYPLLDKCKIPNRPLARMVVGLFISSGAFVCAGLIQYKIDINEARQVVSGESGVLFLNTIPCRVKIESPLHDGFINDMEMTEFYTIQAGNYSVNATTVCPGNKTQSFYDYFILEDSSSYRFIIYLDEDDDSLNVSLYLDERTKPHHGDASISIFTTSDILWNMVTIVPSSYKHYSDQRSIETILDVEQNNVSKFHVIQPARYTIFLSEDFNDSTILTDSGIDFTISSGGVYTVYYTGNSSTAKVHLYADVKENTVSMLWLTPQYFLITLGEVLFSISGLSFAYSQAPSSLKSVVQSIWLLTVSMGDLVVIIVANIRAIPSQMIEFYIFALLMFLDTLVFMVMSLFYVYKPNSIDYIELVDDGPAFDASATEIAEENYENTEGESVQLKNM
ncbi:hypothetical protein ACF0H5_023491 [Mactra antiquata]